MTANSSVDGALAQLATRLRESTVQVRSGRASSGSGIIWNAGGIILTNAHVAQHPSATVELADGRTLHATLLARDKRRDLAALSVNATGLPAAEIGNSSNVRVGELVAAVGNPLGLVGAITLGIVHAMPGGNAPVRGRWIQADVRLAPGNSGGPLADTNGRVIGINSMIAGGLALAVPSNAAVRFLERGEQAPFFGVASQPAAVMHEGRRTLGLVIVDVVARSAAAEANIAVGDIIIALGGVLLRDPDDLSAALEDADYGDVLHVELLRAGVAITRHVPVRGAPKNLTAAA